MTVETRRLIATLKTRIRIAEVSAQMRPASERSAWIAKLETLRAELATFEMVQS